MTTQAITPSSQTHCHDCPPNEESFFKSKKFRLAMAILEKISLVALAAFAAYTNPKLFFPFFGAGILLGAYLHWNKKPKEHHGHAHEEGGGCSQGFIEQLTGVKLPPPLGLAANIAITVVHIDHHDTVFVPLTGLNAGMWVGKLMGEYIPLGYQKAVDWINQHTQILALP
jgi:hypothetical protein